MSAYRLIWFQHFHKSAGTTIVKMAQLNGESLYPMHLNGNPVDKNGEFLPIWTYSSNKLIGFIDHCEDIGCTFLGPAWGVGDLGTLKKDDRVKIVTVMRDPFERFVSNYKFDFRLGYTDKQNIRDYVGSKRSFSFFNYYCHMLAQLPESDPTLPADTFRKAMEMILNFDHISILGSPFWLENFCKAVEWEPIKLVENQRKNAAIEVLRNILRGRLEVARRIAKSTKVVIDNEFRREFEGANELDYQIFKYIEGIRAVN